jgi:hypothetical protein
MVFLSSVKQIKYIAMKKNIHDTKRFFLVFWLLSLFTSQIIVAQDHPKEYQHFQLGLAFGGSLIARHSNFGFGLGAAIEPRYFINNQLAIVARSQVYSHLNVIAEPGQVENDISTTSYMAGILFMNREKRNPFFWGVNTGVAITEEVIGIDNDGFAIMGDPASYWALQPRIGGCLGKIEGEISYHFTPSSYARFLSVSVGIHFWGKQKK